MRIAIMGAGALGSLFGALLSDAGEDVTLVEIRDEVVSLIKKEGITVTMPSGEVRHVMVNITGDVRTVGVCDLVVIAVKSFATESAVKAAGPSIGPETCVMSVQNGAGNIEAIARAVGDEARAIGGVFLSSVTPVRPNELVYIYGAGGLTIGPAGGAVTERIQEIALMFRRSGIEAQISQSVQDLVWNKLLMNSINCLAAVLGITNNEFLVYPSVRELVTLLFNEGAEVARARGIRLSDPADPIRPLLGVLKSFAASGQKGKASMLQDIERGSRTEIEAINGTIVREGQRHGIPTPVNEAFVLLVKGLEERASKGP